MTHLIDVHPDITRAQTPPAEFYTDPATFDLLRKGVLERSWHLLGDASVAAGAQALHPFTLLPGCLNEPLLLARDPGNQLRCLSNVCTHRGTILVEQPGQSGPSLRCRYHGRRFGLDGRFESMPEFEGCKHFPTEADNLAQIPLADWRGHRFVNLRPAHELGALVAPMVKRVGWLPIEKFKHDPARSRSYTVKAHWALYVDNYLEGFHVPFVHPGLSKTLDYGEYTTELFEFSSLQLGIAKKGEPCFDLPKGHPDSGKRVAAWYWWLFPCTMFNFYPWGLSVNQVLPVGPEETRVEFISYVWDDSKLASGAGSGLDQTQREDEAVVEAVQRGLKGRFYKRGRYSPTREAGTHHFHRLLAACLSD
jgi:choline monooxygenase